MPVPELRIPAPRQWRITELRVEILVKGHGAQRIPAIRDTVVQIGRRFVNGERATRGQHAAEQVHEIVRLAEKFQHRDLLLSTEALLLVGELLRHVGLLARDQEPQPAPCTGRGRPPGQRHVVARLTAPRVREEARLAARHRAA